jgi:serine phosphatase RsbU (regulator of sigma subunit)
MVVAARPVMSPFTRNVASKMPQLPSSRGRVIAAIALGLGVPLIAFTVWYLQDHDLVIESGEDLVVPAIVVGSMLVLSAVVGWLLHGAARRALNRVRVESSIALDRQLVVRMQRALLPSHLPTVEGLEIEGRYQPTETGAAGGDWYMAVPLGNERIGIAVGEVPGGSVQSAARMAEVAYALRTLALDGDGPSVVLEQLNAHLYRLAEDGVATPATAVYGILNVPSRQWLQCVAGQCSPLLRHPDGRLEPLDARPSPALGADPHATFESSRVELEDGAALLLYTRGLLTAESDVSERDFSRLSAALKVLEGDLTDSVDRLVRLMLGAEPPADAALVVARVGGVAGEASVAAPEVDLVP